jgi:8-oxo-dGTP pyrophosphatase MutT (NUDIX family)
MTGQAGHLAEKRYRLSGDLAELVAAERSPARPRDASTVVLLREGETGPEVYLMHRHRGMAFAGGYYVFPGGGVDPRDSSAELGWVGPSSAAWARTLGCSPELARALVCAAVRETFEESGVLLAGSGPDDLVADVSGADWEEDRRALEAHELAFSDLLLRRELVVRTDLLTLWSRWVTPKFEPRRFDTRFFVARLPGAQATRDVSSESDSVLWSPLSEVVRRLAARDIAMLPPTRTTCRELAAHPSVDAVIAASTGRSRRPVMPRLVIEDGQAILLVTDAPMPDEPA